MADADKRYSESDIKDALAAGYEDGRLAGIVEGLKAAAQMIERGYKGRSVYGQSRIDAASKIRSMYAAQIWAQPWAAPAGDGGG